MICKDYVLQVLNTCKRPIHIDEMIGLIAEGYGKTYNREGIKRGLALMVGTGEVKRVGMGVYELKGANNA